MEVLFLYILQKSEIRIEGVGGRVIFCRGLKLENQNRVFYGILIYVSVWSKLAKVRKRAKVKRVGWFLWFFGFCKGVKVFKRVAIFNL